MKIFYMNSLEKNGYPSTLPTNPYVKRELQWNTTFQPALDIHVVKLRKKKILTSSRIEQVLSRNVKTGIPSLFPIKRGR